MGRKAIERIGAIFFVIYSITTILLFTGVFNNHGCSWKEPLLGPNYHCKNEVLSSIILFLSPLSIYWFLFMFLTGVTAVFGEVRNANFNVLVSSEFLGLIFHLCAFAVINVLTVMGAVSFFHLFKAMIGRKK